MLKKIIEKKKVQIQLPGFLNQLNTKKKKEHDLEQMPEEEQKL